LPNGVSGRGLLEYAWLDSFSLHSEIFVCLLFYYYYFFPFSFLFSLFDDWCSVWIDHYDWLYNYLASQPANRTAFMNQLFALISTVMNGPEGQTCCSYNTYASWPLRYFCSEWRTEFRASGWYFLYSLLLIILFIYLFIYLLYF
jgi:hypothetical protein